MTQVSKHFMSPVIEEKVYRVFIESVKNTKSSSEVVDFLNDLLSPVEKIMMAKRVAVAFLLLENKYTYVQISKTLKVSKGTIAKIHAVFALQGKGYKKILGDILKRKVAKSALSELLDILTPLPPKGANIGEWKKSKREKKWKREEPL
ncbi:MAG: Trp family transcriptional regulator [Patescibacteria group bacterium]